MIPNIPLLENEIEEIQIPTRTYNIEVRVDGLDDRINGYSDGLDAIRQTVYLILNTERYEYIIYSWNYGVELLDLFGKPMNYVMSEIPRRVKEALTQDDRISDVTNFEFDVQRNKLHTTFVVETKSGNISTELEVRV